MTYKLIKFSWKLVCKIRRK